MGVTDWTYCSRYFKEQVSSTSVTLTTSFEIEYCADTSV